MYLKASIYFGYFKLPSRKMMQITPITLFEMDCSDETAKKIEQNVSRITKLPNCRISQLIPKGNDTYEAVIGNISEFDAVKREALRSVLGSVSPITDKKIIVWLAMNPLASPFAKMYPKEMVQAGDVISPSALELVSGKDDKRDVLAYVENGPDENIGL